MCSWLCNYTRTHTHIFFTLYCTHTFKQFLCHTLISASMFCEVCVCVWWWLGVTVGAFFHYITEQHSVKQAIHHYSCGLCTHSRSCWSSVQAWCSALDYPFALRETSHSNGTKWLRWLQFVRLCFAFDGMAICMALIYGLFQSFSAQFAHNLGLDKFTNLVSQHLWQNVEGEEATRKLTSPINNNLQ